MNTVLQFLGGLIGGLTELVGVPAKQMIQTTQSTIVTAAIFLSVIGGSSYVAATWIALEYKVNSDVAQQTMTQESHTQRLETEELRAKEVELRILRYQEQLKLDFPDITIPE